jgi:hypothetical protein
MSTKNIILSGKYLRIGPVWSASGSLNTPRFGLAGCGTQSATVSFGGYATDSDPYADDYVYTEKFNGSTWSNSGNLNTGRADLGGCGVQDAAVSFGGITEHWTTRIDDPDYDPNETIINPSPPPATIPNPDYHPNQYLDTDNPAVVSLVTETFNGTTWSNSGDLSIAKYKLGSAGSQSSALAIGGSSNQTSGLTSVSSFNGSNWSSQPSLNIVRWKLTACGIYNAALAIGGNDTTAIKTTEKFNGIAWSTGGTLNYDRANSAASGTKNSAFVCGATPISATMERFDGVTWTTDSRLNLLTGRSSLGASGTIDSALNFGGYTGSVSTGITEKFTETYPLLGVSTVSQKVILNIMTGLRAFYVTSTGVHYNLSLDRTAYTTFQTNLGLLFTNNNFTNLGTIVTTFLKTFYLTRVSLINTSTGTLVKTNSLLTFNGADTAFETACTAFIGFDWDTFVEEFFIELCVLLFNGEITSITSPISLASLPLEYEL